MILLVLIALLFQHALICDERANCDQMLEKLKDLYLKGYLDEEQFRERKRLILNCFFKGSTEELTEKMNENALNKADKQYDILVIPFENDTDQLGASSNVHNRITELFTLTSGMSVCPTNEITAFMEENLIYPNHCRDASVASWLAKAYGAKYIITGKITDYRGERKFRMPASIFYAPGTGWTLYTTCCLQTRIWSDKKADFIYIQEYTRRKKRHLVGAFLSMEGQMYKTVKECARHLYRKFIFGIN